MIALLLAMLAPQVDIPDAAAQAANRVVLDRYVAALPHGPAAPDIFTNTLQVFRIGPGVGLLDVDWRVSDRAEISTYLTGCSKLYVKTNPEWHVPSGTNFIVTWICRGGKRRYIVVRIIDRQIYGIMWGAPAIMPPTSPDGTQSPLVLPPGKHDFKD